MQDLIPPEPFEATLFAIEVVRELPRILLLEAYSQTVLVPSLQRLTVAFRVDSF